MNMKIKKSSLDEEYKKTGINPEDINTLRSWVQTQPHLPAEVDDLDLILAFSCCNQSLEVTKQRIDTHYTQRTQFKIFQIREIDKRIVKSLHTYVISLLGTCTFEGNPVLYAQLLDTSQNNFDFLAMSRSALMTLDLYQYEVGFLYDTTLIINCEGAHFGMLAKMDIEAFQQLLYYIKDGIFGKLKEVHFLNTPSFAAAMLRILRPIIPEELLKLVTFHEIGSNTIEKILPLKDLPKECGGQNKSIKELADNSIKRLVANADFFEVENTRRVNEALRPKKPKDLNDAFDCTIGSFKKLELD